MDEDVTMIGDPRYRLKRWIKPQSGIQRVYLNHPDLQARIWFCPSDDDRWHLEFQYNRLSDFGHAFQMARQKDIDMACDELAYQIVEEGLRAYLGYDDDKNIQEISWEEIWKNAL